MKHITNLKTGFQFSTWVMLLIVITVFVSTRSVPAFADGTYQGLPFSQDWTNTGLITVNDNWSGVPGINGFRGDNLTASTGTDPQTLLADDSPGVIDVNANQTNPNTFATGGTTEFEIADPVVALTGSGTADAPYLLLHINATGFENIQVSYNVRDLDGSTDDAVQQVALHYRIGATGNYTNVPAAYIADATTGPSQATLVTPISVALPAAADNQSQLQLRIMTTNAAGNDEWVGIDDISITGTPIAADTAPSVVSTAPTNGAVDVATDANIDISFSETVNVAGTWFDISCATSGAHTAVVSGGPTDWTLDPNVDFANSETCTVTLYASQITDQDSNDPPDNMDTDYLFSFTTAAAVANPLRISQVYGGGGNSGATYTHDFIELYNAGTTTLNLNGLSVQYASAAGTSWQVTNLTGSLVPGQYYLIQQAAGTGGTTALPTPDATGTIAMAATNGKVALVNSTTALSGSCPLGGNVLDFVGFGTANCFEGAGATPALTNTTADLRNNNGCQDTDQNAADFTVGAPTPRNTQSPLYNCTTGDHSPAVSSTTPTDGATGVVLNTDITLNFSEAVTLDTGWYNIACGTSGTHTAVVTGGPQNWTLNPDVDFVNNETCTVTLTAGAVHDVDSNDPPDTMGTNYVFSFVTTDGGFGSCDDDAETRIHTIQGAGLTSPVVGSTPVIEGIVTADYQDTATLMGGFFIQEEDADADGNNATSEGIYVFNSALAVSVGDLVRLQGTVVEFTSGAITFTEISPVSTLTICSNGNPLPAAIPLTLPVASVNDLEAYEGMRVSLAQTLYVTEHFTLGRYGEVRLSANDIQYQFTHSNLPSVAGYATFLTDFARSTITLDDANTQQNKDPIVHPSPGLTALNTLRIGDTVTGLTGILDHRFDLYRIQPTGVVPFTTSNPRPAAPDNVGGTIWVASFNVLNYFSTLDLGPDICGPAGNQECRGADSASEFTRQRDKIVAAIIALDADVIGLMEMENHISDAALDDLISGLNAVAGAGTYVKISEFPLGTDAIKVALIYRPARVTPVGVPLVDNNAVFDRPPLSHLFQVNNTGEQFNVIVNHFKSKGCGGAAGADQDQFDGQGCFNDRRTQQATQLLSFISSVVVTTGDSDVLILGDLNAYALENPITTLTGGGMTNLLSSYLGTNTFSYIFGGQAGYLDHALASASLTSQVTGVTHWGINGDEPISLDYNEEFKSPGQVSSLYNADPFRSSDHSPVLVGIYPYDFTDLPGSYGTAWHTEGGALRLGTNWTADRTFGDDTDNSSDDGIERLGSGWVPGATVTLRATVTRVSGSGGGWLSCWMDWDGDGVFAAAAERAINTAVTEGINDINLTIPGSAPGLANLEARCRLYDSATEPFAPLVATPTGAGTGGEVEDYNWSFSPTAITLQEIEVVGAAAAPVAFLLAVILLGGGSAWMLRRRIHNQ